MSVIGKLLMNRRPGPDHAAWNRPNLAGPELLMVSSADFVEGGTIALLHCAKHIRGKDVSPQLTWSEPPPGTAQLLLVVEDIDAPMPKPIVHCTAVIDAALTEVPAGGLAARQPAAGVTAGRAFMGRGYHGPGPIKGHGPHHYTFQLFALGAPLAADVAATRPRTLLDSIAVPVLARGRITGTVER